MAQNFIASIQLRRDTKANWEQINPVLKDGEFVIITDTSEYKVGDGVTRFNALPVKGYPAVQDKGTSTSNVMSQKAVTDELNRLDINKFEKSNVSSQYPSVEPSDDTSVISAKQQFKKDKEQADKIVQLEQESITQKGEIDTLKEDVGSEINASINVTQGVSLTTDHMPISIQAGSKYCVKLSCLSSVATGNMAVYRYYADGTRDYDNLTPNDKFVYLTAEKEIVSFTIFISGSIVLQNGVVRLLVRELNTLFNTVRACANMDNAWSDNYTLNNAVSELYLPNVRAEDIISARIVKNGVSGTFRYNALYIFTRTGNIPIFTDLFSTEYEAKNTCMGLRGGIKYGAYAIIDFRSINDGTTNFDNIYVHMPVNNISYSPTIMKELTQPDYINMDWLKCFFSKVICCGDSITEGNIYDYPNHVGVVSKYSYPAQLSKLSGWNVQNAGVSGIKTTEWYTTEYPKYNFADYQIAILYLGTNGGLSSNPSDGEKYNNYVAYNNIINGIKAQNSKILIFLLIGSNLVGSDTHTANAINTIASTLSLPVIDLRVTYHIDLLDNKYHGYQSGGATSLDYTHFNAIGYLAMAKCVYKNLISYFNNNQKLINDKAVF